MYWLPILILAVLFTFTLTKWILLKKEISGMAKDIKQIRTKKNNERLTVSLQDKHIGELANAVNELYDDISIERTEHNRAATELRQSMANVSHDLRTPLTSIIGYVRLMKKEETTAEQRDHYLSVVLSKAELLNRLVNGLFILTRLEAGEYALKNERVDARDILSEELAGFYDSFIASGKEPDIVIGDRPIWVCGDREAISRIFQNLLQNIIKHGADQVCILAGCKDSVAEFAFSNRAENLRPEDLPDLFNRFFTADRMRSGENTGLGLAIVKEFVEQTGGSVDLTLVGGILTVTIRWKSVP